MARVLVYTSPGSGHVYPPIATAIALQERGHDVSVHAESGSVGALDRLGLSAAPIDPRIEALPLEDWRARTSIGALVSACDTFAKRARYEVPNLQAAIEAEHPDLIWVDTNAWGAAVVAEASGVPWAHCLPHPHPGPARGVPAFGPGFAPSTSRLARLRDTTMTALKPLAFRSFMRSHNRHRTALDLPALDGIEDHYLVAPLLIQFSAEPFEYPREWPANVRLVGPALWEPPGPEPEWLAAEERPIVLVTASTEFQDDAKLIRGALEAFADQPYAVIATSAAHDPGDFDVPSNARVGRRLPHRPILRRATAVISHGGMGTTQKALAAGVPVCVVPFIRDQLEVARRVEHCGGGTLLPAKRLRPDRLRSAVEGAIACRKGAERVRDAFGRAGGAEAAASALEGLLAPERKAVEAGR
ncbi:MAG TPA: nucleotide disphospho-sugar-binding domain-containing protein [Solirubrobacterales bacterium]|jgi:MGT family glycosyltransferase|nr:nucleotide disphospho-sugar-binding domain-containing protein [Solirubrobacterales bacterium]